MATHQAMLNLHDSGIFFAKMSEHSYNSKYFFDKDGAKLVILKTSVMCCIVAHIFHDYESSSKFIEIYKRDKENFDMKMFKVIFYFYDGLLARSIARNIERKEKYVKIFDDIILNLKTFAENAPMNFLNKFYLLR